MCVYWRDSVVFFFFYFFITRPRKVFLSLICGCFIGLLRICCLGTQLAVRGLESHLLVRGNLYYFYLKRKKEKSHLLVRGNLYYFYLLFIIYCSLFMNIIIIIILPKPRTLQLFSPLNSWYFTWVFLPRAARDLSSDLSGHGGGGQGCGQTRSESRV